MTLAGGVLIVALILVVVLGLVVAWLWQDRKTIKASEKAAWLRADLNAAEIKRLTALSGAVAKVEEKRNEQKNAVAAGGFAGSLDVLHDLSTKPKT